MTKKNRSSTRQYVFSLVLGLIFMGFGVPGLQADIIDFKDQPRVSSVKVISDTLGRVRWEGKADKTQGNAYVWEVKYYRLKRGKKNAQTFEDAWNKAIKRSVQGTWPKVEEAVEKALELEEPEGYGEVDGFRLRLLYAVIRAHAELGTDPSSAFDDYVAEARSYAKKLQELRRDVIGKQVSKGPFKGVDFGLLHASVLDAYYALGIYYQSQGQLEEAYEKGYLLAKDLAEELYTVTGKQEYLKEYAIPFIERAAEMFTLGEKKDWEKAVEVYELIGKLALKANEIELSESAKMKAARSYIYLGDTGRAERTFKGTIRDFEEYADEAPAKDWLDQGKARSYAAAYTGLGLVSYEKKEYFKALRTFSKALCLFSIDDEERAEALLYAGLCTAKLAKANNQQAAYYYTSGNSYYIELTRTLGHTRAAKQAFQLQAELDSIKP